MHPRPHADSPTATTASLDQQPGTSPAARADNASPGEQTPPRSKLRVALIMLALGIAVLLVALDITIITTALPTISEHFHSSAGYTWVGSAYLLATSAATPIWGKISDIWGRKPILLLANVIFFLGSLLAGVSISIGMLITARAVQGVGGGGLIVLVNICISDIFSMAVRPAMYGVIGGVWALASSLGPCVGGALTQKVSWRWVFYLNLPLDGLAFIIILLALDVHTPRTPLRKGLMAIDWLGFLTTVGGTLMFLFGLEFGGISFPWRSATVICLIVFGALTISLFFVVEYRFATYPLMPLRIFSQRSSIACLGVCFFHAYVFIAGSYYLPLYFQAVLGASPILSGVYLLPTALSLSLTSAITGVVIRKTGQFLPPIWLGFICMTVGYGLFIDLAPGSSWAKIILYQIVAGIGVGPNFQSPLIALQSHVPPRDTATATAAFGFVRNLGSAVSIVVGSVVFQSQMMKKSSTLQQALGSQVASAFDNGSAGANVRIIQTLSGTQRAVARAAFSDSLNTMWIMYLAFAGAGLLMSMFIARNELSKQHHETRTGLEEEKAKRSQMLQERAARKMKRTTKKSVERASPDEGAVA